VDTLLPGFVYRGAPSNPNDEQDSRFWSFGGELAIGVMEIVSVTPMETNFSNTTEMIPSRESTADTRDFVRHLLQCTRRRPYSGVRFEECPSVFVLPHCCPSDPVGKLDSKRQVVVETLDLYRRAVIHDKEQQPIVWLGKTKYHADAGRADVYCLDAHTNAMMHAFDLVPIRGLTVMLGEHEPNLGDLLRVFSEIYDYIDEFKIRGRSEFELRRRSTADTESASTPICTNLRNLNDAWMDVCGQCKRIAQECSRAAIAVFLCDCITTTLTILLERLLQLFFTSCGFDTYTLSSDLVDILNSGNLRALVECVRQSTDGMLRRSGRCSSKISAAVCEQLFATTIFVYRSVQQAKPSMQASDQDEIFARDTISGLLEAIMEYLPQFNYIHLGQFSVEKQFCAVDESSGSVFFQLQTGLAGQCSSLTSCMRSVTRMR
jgi:hypothetical protein